MKQLLKNKKVAILIVFVCLFAFAGIFYFTIRSVQTPIATKPSIPEDVLVEGVPTTYSECVRTNERHDVQGHNDSNLRCSYTVAQASFPGLSFQEGDEIKYKKCTELGGRPMSYGGDCSLIFYNPDYVFPKSFEECVKEKKGEFTTSVSPRCIIEIDGSLAYNTEVANGLIKQCVTLGGSYSEQFGHRCYMEFEESNPLSQTQVIPHITCKITGQAVEGPYYRAEAPFRTILAPTASGEKVVISGTVYASDCKTPLVGALVDIWHADSNGNYDETSSDYRYRGRMLTDQNGHYQLETILPGYYRLGNGFRPRHIHFKVSKSSYLPLTTQLYFNGDPYLMPNDACATCGSDDPTLIIPLKTELDREVYIQRTGTFDVILDK